MPTRECSPLLDICGPDIYRRNAFRLLAADVDHKGRQIKRNEKELIAALEVDDLADEYSDALRPSPLPTREELSQAGRELVDAQKRFVHEFFWFWPLEWGESGSDEALNLIKANKMGAAKRHWETLAANGSHSSAVAKHNLAVLGHSLALDYERTILTADGATELTQDQRKQLNVYWNFAYKYWKPLYEDESFWAMQADRIRVLNDPCLTTGFVRRMSQSLPIALGKINAQLAVTYCDRKIFVRAKDHVQIMRATTAEAEDINAGLRQVTAPLYRRIDHAVQTATSQLEQNKSEGKQRCVELYNSIRTTLNIFHVLMDEESREYCDACDKVAEAMLQCQVAYGNETEDWGTSLYLLEATFKIAHNDRLRARIEENLKTVRGNKQFDTCWFCEKRRKDEKHTVQVTLKKSVKWREIKNNPDKYREAVMQIVAQVAPTIGRNGMQLNSRGMQTAAAMMVALKTGNIQAAVRAIDGFLNDSSEVMSQERTISVPRCSICGTVHSSGNKDPARPIREKLNATSAALQRETNLLKSLQGKIASREKSLETAWLLHKWALSLSLKTLHRQQRQCEGRCTRAKTETGRLQSHLKTFGDPGHIKPYSHREAWPPIAEGKKDGFHIA